MGMYCCCGARLSERGKEECRCDWDGWTIWGEDGNLPHPPSNGIYKVRYVDNGGDKHEGEMEFSLKPFRIDYGYFGISSPYPIHWKDESWDDNYVYAWKSKEMRF